MRITRLSSLLTIILLLTCVTTTRAQRIISELESNTGVDLGVEGDSIDEKEGHRSSKVVPVDITAHTIHPIYAETIDVDVDTLTYLYQNSDRSEGLFGQYNTLSNLGSPRINRIYMQREVNHEFIFTQPFDQFLVPLKNFRHYNTKSPYMNLTYNWCGSKQTGSDHFRAIYTNNVGKHFNFGAIYDYMYGQGYYDNQSTSFMGPTAFFSYINDRYDLHFRYTHNYMKMGENGGITDDGYITNPENMTQKYDSKDIPTNLQQTWVRQEHDIVNLNHRYHIGFHRTEGDSTSRHEVFVPVTSLFHAFTLESDRRNYKSYVQPTNYYTHQYLPGDSVNDRHSMFEIVNNVGVTLHEGFNRYAVAGLSAYVGFRHRHHVMPDTIAGAATTTLRNTTYNENDVLIGGQLRRTQGTYIHYDAEANVVVAGTNAGDMNISGTGELNLPLLGDTAQVQLQGLISRENPNFYYDHYHSTYAWWDRTCDRVTQTRLGATITVPHTKTQLTVQLENIKNYTYFANVGTAVTTSDGTTVYTNEAVVRQCSDNIQIISAQLLQRLKFGPLHFNNDITYQTTSHKDVLPLPVITLHSNLFLDFKIAKVLNCQVGADLTYFTEYFAPDYSPAIGQFVTQQTSKRIPIGNYPLINVYANLALKRCRFYIQYYHVNQSDGRYFWAPHYPMNPSGLHMGISWNFYD